MPPLEKEEGVLPSVWVARTKSGQHTPEYLAGGYAAVGWVSWEADAKSLTREQLKQKHSEREPDDSPPSVGQKIGQLWAFLHDIQPGDYIINPSANMNELHYGVVEGGPYYDTSERYSDGCLWPHRRRVKWSDETIARQALPDPVKSSVDHGARTLFCVSAGHEFLEWLEKRNAATQVLRMVCPSCGEETSEHAAFCTQCGTSFPKHRSRPRSILQWGVIGCGSLLGLFIAIVIIAALTTDSPSSEEQETPSPTVREAFLAGIDTGDNLRAAGRELDDDFVQEAVSRVESEIFGGSDEWIVHNSDILAVCDVYSRIGDAAKKGEDLTRTEFEDVLREEFSMKGAALMGAVQSGTDEDSEAIIDFCGPIDAYGVGFIAAFESTAGFYEFDVDEADAPAELNSAIDQVSRPELRGDTQAAYQQGVLAGMNSANEIGSNQSTVEASTRSIDTPRPFGDGAYRIGRDISPGTYAAPGGDACLWNRLGGFSGGIDDILRPSHRGRPIVTVADTWNGSKVVGFQSFGCGQWHPITDISEPVESIRDGTWLVGKEIAPGTYAASENCFWSRLSGFNGESDDIIAQSDLVEEKPTVTIEPTDAGFTSFGCGKWTRVK